MEDQKNSNWKWGLGALIALLAAGGGVQAWRSILASDQPRTYDSLLVTMMPDAEGTTRMWATACLSPEADKNKSATEKFATSLISGDFPKSLQLGPLLKTDLNRAEPTIIIRVGKQGEAKVDVRIVGLDAKGNEKKMLKTYQLVSSPSEQDLVVRWRD